MIDQMPVPDGHAGTRATQAQVSALVERCHASAFVSLQALTSKQVVIDIKHNDRPPSPAEEAQFECVLKAVQEMPKLQLGFIGNAADPEAKK